MKFLIKRELITNIILNPDIHDIEWEKCKLSIVLDPSSIKNYEVQIKGDGNPDEFIDLNKTELLMQLLDKLAFYTQSHVVLGDNFAIFQACKGEVRKFTYYICHEKEMAGFRISTPQVKTYKTILGEKYDENIKIALRWLRRAIICKFTYEAFFYEILATESLTGEIKAYPKCSAGCPLEKCLQGHDVREIPKTNHKELKIIIGTDLYSKIYSSGLRNDLFHGKYVTETEFGPILHDLHKKILEYINNKVDNKIEIPEHAHCKYGWGRAHTKLLYDTRFPDELLPTDTPTILELKQAFENSFNIPGPKNIRMARFEEHK
ncbi:MAG: hypothetical protein V1853_04720 [bacterium]